MNQHAVQSTPPEPTPPARNFLFEAIEVLEGAPPRRPPLVLDREHLVALRDYFVEEILTLQKRLKQEELE